jgi:hypothetical protein
MRCARDRRISSALGVAMNETEHAPTPCPFCDYLLDAATHATDDNARPSRGDLSVCLSCSEILIFDEELRPRAPYKGEVEAQFSQDPAFEREVRRHQQAIRAINRTDLWNPK